MEQTIRWSFTGIKTGEELSLPNIGKKSISLLMHCLKADAMGLLCEYQ